MKKFMTILVLAIVASTGNIYAQYASDALRFSQGNYGSSARFKALGGAQISLGGDISSLGANPAGLGMFTKSEFSITPEFDNTKAESTYLGQTTNGNKNQLNLNNVGAVWYSPILKAKGSDLDKGLISVVWGLGYNRTNDFSSRVNFGGVNRNSSIADSFAEMANGATTENLNGSTDLAGMAYQNFLIDQQAIGSTNYTRATSLNNTQNQTINRSGSTSELNFSAGLNFSNKFYLGASIGVVNLRYVSDADFREGGTIDAVDPTNPTKDPNNEQVGSNYLLSYRQSQVTNGSGINAKLGLIFKPADAVRIGATFVSPTWMRVEDNYAEVLDTRFDFGNSVDNFNNNYDNYGFDYNLRTPYKGSLGASVIIGNNALLSADVDYIDYASMKISPAGNNVSTNEILNSNADIKSNYSSAINYRVGGEYKIGQLALRAGYAMNGSPYKDNDSLFDTKYYSGGLGYRFSQYYIDLAYQRVEANQTYNPYPVAASIDDPMATVKQNKNNVFLTVGVKF